MLGGVGVGKTAVLFRLTRLLAENRAVPVPIRLRDAEKDLDFIGLARKRFVAQVADASISDAEAERVWRELRKDDQVVVLADGLEEALSDNSARGGQPASGEGAFSPDDTERDNRIRLAIRDAGRTGLPLVIASRPHDALVGLDAAVVELEDLGEEAALEYIGKGASAHEARWLDWVIETADVTETPLFLQIARELHEAHLLDDVDPRRPKRRVDARALDRTALRVRLLESWTAGLINGHFESQLPMTRELRKATVAQLALFACMGLRKDTLEVGFAGLLQETLENGETGYRHAGLIEALKQQIAQVREHSLPGAGSLAVNMEREEG